MEKEPTLKEVLATVQDVVVAVQEFAQKTQENFEKIDERFDKIDKKFIDLEKNLRVEISTARDAALEHADKKSTDAIFESGKRINDHKDRDKNFKQKLVAVMKNNDLVGAHELKGLTQAI